MSQGIGGVGAVNDILSFQFGSSANGRVIKLWLQHLVVTRRYSQPMPTRQTAGVPNSTAPCNPEYVRRITSSLRRVHYFVMYWHVCAPLFVFDVYNHSEGVLSYQVHTGSEC